MTDDTDLKDTSANDTDRGADRGERAEHELSGGRRDRSRELLRNELTKNLVESNRRTGGKRHDFEPADRPARQARDATATEAKDREPGTASSEPGAAPGTGGAAVDLSVPPARLNKEQKEKWPELGKSELGKYWQGVIHKIDTDSQRGHDEDKQKRAAEDAAWAPHEPVLRQFSKSRAETVTQLMSWFNYLHKDPLRAFPDLVKSMGAEKIFQQQLQQQQAGAQPQPTTGGAQQLDPQQWLQQQIDARVGAHVGPLQQQFQSQQEARTQEILAQWSKDKKHFSRVRLMMSHLLMPNPATGESIIPLNNGAVDLDRAYSESLKLVPDVWAEVQAEERAKDKRAAKEQVERSRYASSSLTPRAPGGNNSLGGAKKRGGSRSVRDLINDSINELRE